MSNVKTSISRTKVKQVTTKSGNKGSLSFQIKHRLEVLNKAPTAIYQREGSKVYTVICIACVGVTLIGLGGGLIVYAQDTGISDLVVIGGFGIMVGLVSLIAALTFLLKPIIERRHRNVAVAATVQKQRNVSVAPGLHGYVYRHDSDIDLEKASTPSTIQLYDLQKRPSGQSGDVLHVSHPTDKKDLPTYKVKVDLKESESGSDSENKTNEKETTPL